MCFEASMPACGTVASGEIPEVRHARVSEKRDNHFRFCEGQPCESVFESHEVIFACRYVGQTEYLRVKVFTRPPRHITTRLEGETSLLPQRGLNNKRRSAEDHCEKPCYATAPLQAAFNQGAVPLGPDRRVFQFEFCVVAAVRFLHHRHFQACVQGFGFEAAEY